MNREFILFLSLIWPMLALANDTELQLYRPFTQTNKQSTFVVSTKMAGECWRQSQRTTREDAWRCIAGNKIYDPCFVNPYGSAYHVICPETPWSVSGPELTTSTPLDTSRNTPLDMSRAFPWAVELTDGEKCQAVEAGYELDGLPLRYRCNATNVLIGHVQRCSAIWKMLEHSANGVSILEISKAWF